jgi:hypothetical protein
MVWHDLHIAILIVFAFVRKRIGSPGEQHDIESLEKPFTALFKGHIVTGKVDRDRAPSSTVLQAAIAEDVEGRSIFRIAQRLMQR